MSIKSTVDGIRKKHGDNSILKLGDKVDMQIDFIPTGIPEVDDALGGGMPKGRIIEVFGLESSAKTTLALYTIAEAQRQGLACAFLDVEHALNPDWAEMVGVDTGELFISQPNSGEEALEITEELIESNEFGVVVVDSVSTLIPLAEVEGDMTDANMGSQARMMSKAMRKLTRLDHETACIFINQIRYKIGGYGNPETVSGGVALKFAASMRIKTKQKAAIKDRITEPGSSSPVGVPIEIQVVKNKCAPPLRIAQFDLLYETGVDIMGSLLNLGVAKNIIGKSGNHFHFDGEKLGNGKRLASIYLRENPETLELIKKAIEDES